MGGPSEDVMIQTQQVSIEVLTRDVPAGEPVGIIGCGDCAAALHTGGTKQVDALREALQGRNPVAFATVADAPCDQRVLRRFLGLIKGYPEARTVILLACPAGAQSLATLFRDEGQGRRLVIGLQATGLGWIGRDGRRHEGCVFCTTCTFESARGICPTAGCPLHRADGPCPARAEDDRCPARPEIRCVWIGDETVADREQGGPSR